MNEITYQYVHEIYYFLNFGLQSRFFFHKLNAKFSAYEEESKI